jgi:hypothetical protein
MVARTAVVWLDQSTLQLLCLGAILPTYQRGRLCEIGKFGDCHHPKDSGARDEFDLAAIVQNLKTMALHLLGPPTGQVRASIA